MTTKSCEVNTFLRLPSGMGPSW